MQSIYPWHHENWQKLLESLCQNRLPHALLLVGLRGLGKNLFAELFAKRLLCEVDADIHKKNACGVCRSCQLFEAGSHPDFFKIVPEEDRQIIKIQQVRDLITKLSNKPERNRYRVVLLCPAHALNRIAANALLKTLEEPPEKTIFLLITSHIKTLPRTILSRCQQLYFSLKNNQDSYDWIKLNAPEHNNPELLLKLADFSPLQALQFIKENYLATRQLVLDEMQNIIMQKSLPVIAAFKELEPLQILRALLSFVLDLIRLQQQVSNNYLINIDCIEKLSKMQVKIDNQKIVNYLDNLQEIYRLLLQNVPLNKNLLLEKLFIELYEVAHAH
jgi:DNA polymerase-3 subunit delta'